MQIQCTSYILYIHVGAEYMKRQRKSHAIPLITKETITFSMYLLNTPRILDKTVMSVYEGCSINTQKNKQQHHREC